jgi:hypothetical protein
MDSVRKHSKWHHPNSSLAPRKKVQTRLDTSTMMHKYVAAMYVVCLGGKKHPLNILSH